MKLLSRVSCLRTMNQFAVLFTLLSLRHWSTATVSAGPVSSEDTDVLLADGESEFVSRLLEQQLFEVAARYCERSASATKDVEQKTAWELLLAECRLQQLWSLPEESRTETIRLAVQQLSDFRTTNAPSATQDIRLRLTQLELLAVAGLIEECLQTSVSTKFKSTTVQPTASYKFALKALEQSLLEADSLLKQVDQIRKELDPSFARITRERIRLLSAQMHLSRARLKPAPDDQVRLRSARTATEQLAKSTADEALKFRARAVLAELSMDIESPDSFQLKIKSLEESAVAFSDRVLIESLQIRFMLKQGRPSDALSASIKGDNLLLESSSELKVLRLLSLLQIYELLFELPRSDSTETLKANTEKEFRTLSERILPGLKGVWKERGLQVSARFDRLVKVGPKMATALEDAAALVQNGDSGTAMKRLQEIAASLPTSQTGLRGSLLLELAQLAVTEKDWSVAERACQDSAQAFSEGGQNSQAAASDLLKIYVLGQRWIESTSDDKHPEKTPESRETLERSYHEAIDLHIQKYQAEATVSTAREWRAKLLAETNPLVAASDLLNPVDLMLNSESSAAARDKVLRRLCFAGECLFECGRRAASLTPDELRTYNELMTALGQQSAALTTVDGASNLLTVCLAANVLGLSITTPEADPQIWETRAEEARQLLARLPDDNNIGPDKSLDSAVEKNSANASIADLDDDHLSKQARLCCHMVLIASAFRCLNGQDTIVSSKAALSQEPVEDRLRWIQLISLQISKPEKAIPGDPQLAAFLGQLMAFENSGTTQHSITVAISVLRMQSRLSSYSKDWKVFNDHLQRLSNQELPEKDFVQLARFLADLNEAYSDINSRAPFEKAATDFWKQAHKRTTRGQDIWLEASLSLAESAIFHNDKNEARKIIGVVKVLYPEWGNEARSARAGRLEKLLTSPEVTSP